MSDVLIALLLLAPIIDWATVAMLALVSRSAPEIRSLRERLWVALAIAIGTTLIALLVINSRWLHAVPSDIAVALLVVAIVAPSAVNGLWLYRGMRGTL